MFIRCLFGLFTTATFLIFQNESKTDRRSISESNSFKKSYEEKQRKECEGKTEQHVASVGEKVEDLSIYHMDETPFQKEDAETTKKKKNKQNNLHCSKEKGSKQERG